MKSSRIELILVLALVAGCGGGGSGGGFIIPPPTLKSIAVTPANPSVALGVTEQFRATGTYSDNSTQNLTSAVSWTSSSPGVAIISNMTGSHGLATSIAVGSTTITAVTGSISGFTALSVTPAALASINVMPAHASIALGAAQQFTATGIYTDNTTSDLTTSATWTSSSPGVAIVSNATGSQGLATAIVTGFTQITAQSGNIQGAANLTVNEADNVLPITVNGSLCSANSYPNKPCVSIVICTHGTATCQTINDILLDTGSYGLRIFKQALNGLALSQVTSGSRSIAECVQFADGSSDWGPVQIADVILGNESAVQVPIHVIDSTFGTNALPTVCSNADPDPVTAGFNGILGVGLFTYDCGLGCSTSANNGIYYSCSGSSCSGSTVALISQVQNPVWLLPKDNNGVIVQLPGIPLGGLPSVNGRLFLGIDTQSNNSSSGATKYAANQLGEFVTNLTSTISYPSFIDSGSNGLFFDASKVKGLPDCGGSSTGWFCPSSIKSLSATNTGASGTPSGLVNFQIGNANSLFISSNNVFGELGGSFPGFFDWGLPFYLGRSVFVGIEGQASNVGTGPYWAY